MNDELRIKNKKVTLFIDTSDNKEIRVGLKFENTEDFVTSRAVELKAQATLPLIEKLLQKHHLTKEDISHIEVVKGPGSFTGLRVGVSIANALSFALGVPVNDKALGEIEGAAY